MKDVTPKISAEILAYVVDWLERKGAVTAPLLHDAGIAANTLNSRDSFVDLARYTHFFELAAERTHLPNLGLKAALFKDPASMSALGYLFMSAPKLSEAIRYFVNHLSALQDGTFHNVTIDEGVYRVEYRIIDNAIVHRRQDAEYSIGVINNLVRIYSEGRVSPREVCFEHRCLSEYDDYWMHFGCDVFFDQPINSISYALNDVDAPRLARHSMLTEILSKHLEGMSKGREGRLKATDKVRELIAAGMNKEPQVASALSQSVSTLSRRLKAEGSSFRALLIEHRISNAKRMLLISDRSIAEIALAVGYAESSSFIRAFRQLNGSSPSQYRQMANQQS